MREQERERKWLNTVDAYICMYVYKSEHFSGDPELDEFSTTVFEITAKSENI